MKADESLPRNPVLAKFFRIAKLCESAGYGFDKMLEWKKQTGNNVFFETQIDKTKFTFMIDWKNDIQEETVETNSQKNNQKTARKQPENNIENNIEKLTINQKKIVEHINNNPFITSKELSKIIGITADNILVNIAKLKNKGIIRRDGADKGGKWIILSEHL